MEQNQKSADDLESSVRYGKSDSQLQFESLISYFKWLVWITLGALSIIVTMGLTIFYRNISDVKSEARASIEQTKDSANKEISKIQDQAAKIALAEAQRRIDIAFQAPNINKMIEVAAKRQMGSAMELQVKAQVDQETKQLRDDITFLGKISGAGARMRLGIRAGLEELRSLERTANYESERENARTLLETITSDYEHVITTTLDPRISTPQDYLSFTSHVNVGTSDPVVGLVQVIRTDPNLNAVAASFIGLRKAVNVQFKMFDLDEVEKWCAGRKDICKASKSPVQ
jgi:hypothetical protein